jgi:hypothetical protein
MKDRHKVAGRLSVQRQQHPRGPRQAAHSPRHRRKHQQPEEEPNQAAPGGERSHRRKTGQYRDKTKYFDLYEIDVFDRELFSGRMSELNAERNQLLSRKSEIEFELSGDNSQTVSYKQVRSLIERFEYLLQKSSFDQRKTLLLLIIQKITLNEKRRIDKVELAFAETTEHHLLGFAPSAENIAEGAFSISEKAPKLKHKLTIII